ncbi:MAG: lipopolysaccharide biosynthesis protein [Planctomycetota bacterium]
MTLHGWRQRVSGLAGQWPAEAVRGAGWVAAGKGASEAARFVKVIILARLLSPTDFGQMGVALVVLGCMDVFTEPGLNMALIQRKGEIRPYLDTVFTIGALRGLAVALLIVATAPACGRFFHVTESVGVIQVMSIVVVLGALTNPSTVHLTRELNFGRIFYWNLSEAVTGLATAVALGLVYRNVWALAMSSIAGQAVKTVISYRIDDYRPKLSAEWGKVRQLMRFGRWAWASNVLVFLGLQGDNAVVGRVLGPGSLGLYQVASRIGALPRVTFTDIVSQVAYPLFCKHQGDRHELRRLYSRLSAVVFVVNAVFCAAVLPLGDVIILLLLGPSWVSAAPALRILCVANLLRSAALVPGRLFYAVGKPRMTFQLGLARVLTMAITIYPLGALYALNGVAVSVLLSTVAMVPVWLPGAAKVLDCSAQPRPCNRRGQLIGRDELVGERTNWS